MKRHITKKKRFKGIEKGALAIACVFICAGTWMTIRPFEMVVHHSGSGRVGLGPAPRPEHVTKNGARLYGVGCILIGLGLGIIAFYPRRH